MRRALVPLMAVMAGGIVLSTGCAQPAPKETFPEKGKSITMLVGFAPGGSSDIAARLTAAGLEKELGVPVQVVNKAGANGQVAAVELAKSKPDGYTIMATVDVNLINNYLDQSRNANYSRKDFAPIAQQADAALMLAAKSDGPYKTMKDLVEDAKANPEKVKLSTSGILSDTHLVNVMLGKVSGAKFTIVHMEGSGPMLTAMLGGHVDVALGGPAAFSSQVKAGQARILGVATKERSKLTPDVPTLREQGYEVVLPSPRGYVAPASTPKETVETLARAIKKVTDSEEVQKKFTEMGVETSYLGPAEYAAQWQKVEGTLKDLVKDAL